MNAIKHGLTARTLVLPNEDPDEYREMLDSYIQHFHPTSRIDQKPESVLHFSANRSEHQDP